jgi:hypothetical protein
VSGIASAQTGSITRSPLDPKTEFPRMGIEGGLSWVTQTGTYTSGCGTFTDGSGINAVIAGAYDYPISGYVRLEGLLGLQTRHTGSTYNTVENTVIRTSGGFIESDVTYENKGSATFTYLFAQPSVKWYPYKNIYVGAGLSANLFTGASTRYSKSIVTRVVDGGGGEVVEVAYPDADSRDGITKDYPIQDRTDASGMTFDGAAYVGLEFSIYTRLRFSPRLTYTLPLTPSLSEPGETEMKLGTLQATIGFRYSLLD